MITKNDISNESVYQAALKSIKAELPFLKKLLKKEFSKEEAKNVKKSIGWF